MVFEDHFLRLGEEGGRQSATVLSSAVTQWSSNLADCPKDVKIVVRVYANLKGLAKVCHDSGIVDHPAKLEDFARGFTRGKTLCDFVDVGPGKDRADGKITGTLGLLQRLSIMLTTVSETFKLHLYDYTCRNVLFGCSHDNGYARLLEQYVGDHEATPRMTLLEGTPFEKELQVLPFRKHKFDGIFRDRKITLGAPDLLTGLPQRSDSRINGLNPASGTFTPRLPNARPSIQSSPVSVPGLDGLSRRTSHVRNESMASSAATSDSGGAHNSWSKVRRFADLA